MAPILGPSNRAHSFAETPSFRCGIIPFTRCPLGSPCGGSLGGGMEAGGTLKASVAIAGGSEFPGVGVLAARLAGLVAIRTQLTSYEGQPARLTFAVDELRYVAPHIGQCPENLSGVRLYRIAAAEQGSPDGSWQECLTTSRANGRRFGASPQFHPTELTPCHVLVS